MKLRKVVDGDLKVLPEYVFWCPVCYAEHGVNFEKEPRWILVRGGLERPTLNPSVRVRFMKTDGVAVNCHLKVEDGILKYQEDCSHHMRGQDVDMQDMDDVV